MKVLITGTSGFLGSRLKACLQENGYSLLTPSHAEMDLADPAACHYYLQATRPEVVVHCAALSNTGYCQEHPNESLRVNAEGPKLLAIACREVGARFIYMSSDQVYNGTLQDGLLPEDAPLQPVNEYGKHKLLAEQWVQAEYPQALGLRLTWMYDYPDSPYPRTGGILCNLKQTYEKGETLRANPKEHRAVSYVWDVVQTIRMLLTTEASGVLNLGVPNTDNAFVTYSRLAAAQGYPAGLVVSDDSRPGRNLSMDISRLNAILPGNPFHP